MDYSFALSEADTVFLPMMSSIPEIYTQVTLPILTSFAENTDAFYFPIAFGAGGGSGQFSTTSVDILPEAPPAMGGGILLPDSIVCFGTSFESGGFSGRNEFINVLCIRQTAGPASITSEAYERSSLWKIAVVKDGDLYTPVIVYREIPVPPPSVAVDPTSIGFTAMAGNFDPTTHDITIEGDGGVSFELETSDDWIVIQDFQPGGYTTPATITVQGDGTYLGIGDHYGTISIINPYPAETEFNTTVIDVSFHSTDPFALPVGDLNCDGVLSISDIAKMIDHLFINPAPIDPCP
jgi:hypothetical protein